LRSLMLSPMLSRAPSNPNSFSPRNRPRTDALIAQPFKQAKTSTLGQPIKKSRNRPGSLRRITPIYGQLSDYIFSRPNPALEITRWLPLHFPGQFRSFLQVSSRQASRGPLARPWTQGPYLGPSALGPSALGPSALGRPSDPSPGWKDPSARAQAGRIPWPEQR
jgi:hypothetical protein